MEDIAAKSGLARPTASSFGRTFVSVNGGSPRLSSAVREAIDMHLRRLAGLLLVGLRPAEIERGAHVGPCRGLPV